MTGRYTYRPERQARRLSGSPLYSFLLFSGKRGCFRNARGDGGSAMNLPKSVPRQTSAELAKEGVLRCLRGHAIARMLALPLDLSMPEALSVIEQASKYAQPQCNLSGGEPLFRFSCRGASSC